MLSPLCPGNFFSVVTKKAEPEALRLSSFFRRPCHLFPRSVFCASRLWGSPRGHSKHSAARDGGAGPLTIVDTRNLRSSSLLHPASLARRGPSALSEHLRPVHSLAEEMKLCNIPERARGSSMSNAIPALFSSFSFGGSSKRRLFHREWLHERSERLTAGECGVAVSLNRCPTGRRSAIELSPFFPPSLWILPIRGPNALSPTAGPPRAPDHSRFRKRLIHTPFSPPQHFLCPEHIFAKVLADDSALKGPVSGATGSRGSSTFFSRIAGVRAYVTHVADLKIVALFEIFACSLPRPGAGSAVTCPCFFLRWFGWCSRPPPPPQHQLLAPGRFLPCRE